MYCKNCGMKINDSAVVCPNCGARQEVAPNVVDNGGFGWCLLGFCIPLVGLILFLVWNDNKPLTAKSAGKGALISVIVWILSLVFLFILGIAGAA